MEIIDSHQHFWHLERDDYHWLNNDQAAIYRNFLPSDLAPVLSELNVSRTVLVQAAATIAETQYLLDIAEKTPFVAGVVGWVDLERPNEAIAALNDFAGSTKLKAIRPMIQEIPDPDWVLRSDIGTALNEAVELEIAFDALVKPNHLPNLTRFMKRYPDLGVVINHGAKPDIRSGDVAAWKRDMRIIGAESQAYCKLSGLLTEASANAGYDDIRPYMDFLLETFGADRLMWGSDWPVLTLVSDYPSWIKMSHEFLSCVKRDEREKIFAHNACHFYALETVTP